MKVAVVIPTRNEASTIAGTTSVADAGLDALGGEALIVNADGGSVDGTGQVFLATPTKSPKRLLVVDGAPGKGRNLLAAWRFCLDEGVEAVVNLDSDMTTVQPWWIGAFLRPISAHGAEYVSPLYRRNPYHLVSTRNVSRAFVHAWFGVDVQHPLSGNVALARSLLHRLAAREWTQAQLGFGVETAVVATVLGGRRPWATARLDICRDAVRSGAHRARITDDAVTATVEAAREFAPRPGPGEPAVRAPATFIEGPAPDTEWLEEYIASARRSSAAWQVWARWAGDRIAEVDSAFETGRFGASTWYRVLARALLEARSFGRRRPAADYAADLAPLHALRVRTVWREIQSQTAEAIDAAAAAEVGMMRAAVAEAEGWLEAGGPARG